VHIDIQEINSLVQKHAPNLYLNPPLSGLQALVPFEGGLGISYALDAPWYMVSIRKPTIVNKRER
jgi:hypothetical protein